jgi:hypothetical protein
MTRPASWNGVVQTPLRKLWVQCQRVATSLNKVLDSSSAIRELLSPLSSRRLRLASPASAPPSRLIAAYSGGPLLGTGRRGAGLLRDGVVGRPSREGVWDPLRDPPKKGGPGPPQKGGCRDTKQCKFWRVSSVLIQGLFCFLGVRGGLRGGPPGGRFWGGPRVGLSAREPGSTPPAVRPGGSPLRLGPQTMRTMVRPSLLRATSGGVARAGGHSARDKSLRRRWASDAAAPRSQSCSREFLARAQDDGGKSAVRGIKNYRAGGPGADPCRGSVLCSRRSQPSGIVPTTSVGELNSIGEPKRPECSAPPALDST